MPIQPMNYAQLPPQGDPMLDAILPGLMKGMQARNYPKDEQLNQQQMALQNALKQNQLQYAPQTSQANLDLMKAQTANIPIQAQIEQAKLDAQLQKLNQPSAFDQRQALAEQQAKLKADAEANKNWDAALKQAQEETNNYNQFSSTIADFHDAYGKANYTGPRMGSLSSSGLLTPPYSGAPEQTADLKAQQAVAQMLPLLKGGRLTANNIKFVQGTKPFRGMDKDAESQYITQVQAQKPRINELVPFLQESKKRGLSHDQALQLWSQYDQENPALDKQTGKPAEKNVDTWKTFLNKSTKSKGSPQIQAPVQTQAQNQPPPAFPTPGNGQYGVSTQAANGLAQQGIAQPSQQQSQMPPPEKQPIQINGKTYTMADVMHTAQQYNMTPQQVLQKLRGG